MSIYWLCPKSVNQLANIQIELQNIYYKRNNSVMHENGFGIAYGLAAQSFDAGSKRQVLAFYLLCVFLADDVFIARKIAFICTPVIRVEAHYAKRFKESFQFLENFIFTLPKSKG